MKTRSRVAYPEIAWLVILLGLVLRLMVACGTLDLQHPDEHFQTLEPAARAVFGYGWLSWEWNEGLRSWVVPALFMPVLWLMKLFGATSGETPIQACRIFMALVGTGVLISFRRLLDESGFRPIPKLVALAGFALTPALVVWSVATLSDTWAMDLLWLTLPFVIRKLELNPRDAIIDEPLPRWARTGAFWAGVALGVTFPIRIQMAVWAGALFLLLLLSGPHVRRRLPWAVAGFCAPVLLHGLVIDSLSWGHPFHSTWMNVRRNLIDGVAKMYGVAPWYDYLVRVPEDLGRVLSGLIALLIGAGVVLGLSRHDDEHGGLRPRDQWILLPALGFVIFHSALAHKEVRFLLPAYPAIFYALAWSFDRMRKHQGAELLETGGPARASTWAFSAIVLVSLAGFSVPQLLQADRYSTSNMTELMQAVRHDGGLRSGKCLLLVNHYWIWTHGELLQGHTVPYRERRSAEITAQDLAECAYAVVAGTGEGEFAQKAGNGWSLLARSHWGYSVYKRAL